MIPLAKCGVVAVEFELKDALFLSTELENVSSMQMHICRRGGEMYNADELSMRLQLQLAVFNAIE